MAQEPASNRVIGRVVLKESGAGIPDVLVVVFDLDPKTEPEESFSPATGGDRLGSVLTAADGSFELAYDDADFRIRNAKERRPDLLLQVLAPEEADAPTPPLYSAAVVRHNAGRHEQYLVRIAVEQLVKAGLEPPTLVRDDVEPASSRVQRLRGAQQRSGAVLAGELEVARARVEGHRERLSGFTGKLGVALADSLSTLPLDLLEADRLVRPGESPAAKNATLIKRNLRQLINSNDPALRAPLRGLISLTAAERDRLRSQQAPDGSVSEAAVLAVAAGNAAAGPVSRLQREDLLPLCRPPSPATDDCVRALAGPTPPTPPAPPSAPDSSDADSATDAADIPRFIARLLNPLTAPEEQLLTGLTPTATLASVQRNVGALNLRPSPADVPAFHDFHQLQIAFQHVWQELTDRGVLDLAQDAYENIVELGGDPHRPDYKGTTPLHALQSEALVALRAWGAAPPPVVRDHRGDDYVPTPSDGRVRDHRGSSAVDPVVRLPALLQQLQARLREKYSFTIFAANAQHRSVNFGLLNTFRQQWMPLGYQAGPLVKSIPLAPRQTQRVVVTRKVSKKRHQKELERNLRVIRDESSQTQRSEQEIARRASTKTEMSFSNTASGGVEGVASDTATSSFKLDAARSSDDVKKAFRESVLKSAQEVTAERVTELSTDTHEEIDVSETTEISNPNDEIAVTYLFYELQRRYRLHERLHRVMPVVLVAQEVPAPHEIDEDWLIAHDWILRRAVLDDSFLPTLETLTQSAGAATAIAQLAANVSQQRQIVAQLRDEIAIARRVGEVQENLLTDAVGRHTGGGGLIGGLVSGVTGAVGEVVGKVENVLFGGSADQNQGNRDTLRDNADAAADRARELAFRLEREVTALNAITETYARALQAHHTHLTEIARLRVHVKENILHYMQAVWRHEPSDQRYFRLHNTPIPTLRRERRFHIDLNAPLATSVRPAHRSLPRFGGRDAAAYRVETRCQFPPQMGFKPLCEVADLDDLLGFKGNYMLFPLLESNPLTDYMMEPYVDRATGELVDPSDPAGWSLDEFAQYVCCLHETLTPQEFESLRPQLRQQHEALLTAPRRSDDVLVVPTNSLFIECLPAAESLIEPYKRDHRMIDVKKAQGEVRERELENLRRAARLLAGEREDPTIDKRVLVQAGGSGAVLPVVDA